MDQTSWVVLWCSALVEKSGCTSVLDNVPLFSDLSESELQIIESRSTTRSYRKHTVIMEKDDESDSLYVILSGRVKAYVSDEEGKEIVVNMLGPGGYFGELALLGRMRRTASVMTTEDSRLMVIPKHAFLECLTDHPAILLDLIGNLVERLSKVTELVGNLALLDVYGRVARLLANNARERDGKLVTGKLTQQEIANLVGSSREMVSRILNDLKKGGYISIQGKQITINRALPPRW